MERMEYTMGRKMHFGNHWHGGKSNASSKEQNEENKRLNKKALKTEILGKTVGKEQNILVFLISKKRLNALIKL